MHLLLLGTGTAVPPSQVEIVMMCLCLTNLLHPAHGLHNNICYQRGHLGGRVASVTVESRHGRTTLTGTGTGTGRDGTEVAVVLEAVALAVRLRLPMRATLEVLLTGSEASLRHFQPARTRVVIMVVARVALRERSRGSERSKIAQVQMTTHLMVRLSGLRSTGTPALVWARFTRSLDATEEGLDVTEDKFFKPTCIIIGFFYHPIYTI